MIKMKGTLAVPGEYTKDDETYNKTAEELRQAAFRQPILKLTYGHVDGDPLPEQQIGTVSQKWCESTQKVLGEFWFHEEKIPEVLRQRIDNGESLEISADYDADVDEEGNQSGFNYTHVAVLDGENPVCPIDKCGVFRRKTFTEQLDDLAPPEPKAEKEEEAPPEPEPAPDEVVEEEPEQPKPVEEPAEQKPEETDEPAPEEEVVLEPEIIIPAEIVTVRKEFEVIDGKYVFVPQAFKQKQEKSK